MLLGIYRNKKGVASLTFFKVGIDPSHGPANSSKEALKHRFTNTNIQGHPVSRNHYSMSILEPLINISH